MDLFVFHIFINHFLADSFDLLLLCHKEKGLHSRICNFGATPTVFNIVEKRISYMACVWYVEKVGFDIKSIFCCNLKIIHLYEISCKDFVWWLEFDQLIVSVVSSLIKSFLLNILGDSNFKVFANFLPIPSFSSP